jgi:predicted Zn-dependent protease
MNRSFLFKTLLSGFFLMSVASCDVQKASQSINFFSVQDELALGKQVAMEIENDPAQFPILPEKGNEEVYQYIRGLTQKILNTSKVAYRNEFAWEVKIIDDDETLNAFCTPGGYIYVYTGLIKFLDSEDQLMGVMGHEIAHAALRHSTRNLTKVYGVQILYQVITGKAQPGTLEQIAMSLVALKFSRDHETEADEYSVRYLCSTTYNAAGAAGFFRKMKGQPTPPAFLSTHPDPGNRVEKMEALKRELNCRGDMTNQSSYQAIKAKL